MLKVSLLIFLSALQGPPVGAVLSVWPSFHVALSSGSVFVDVSSDVGGASSVSLVDVETNATLETRSVAGASGAAGGRLEFHCSAFLYAGTFRFLLRQTASFPRANGSQQSATRWWSSELRVQWPTFHLAVERAGNHSQSFQVGISTSELFQPCSSGVDSALFLEVSFVEFNQIGRNAIDKVRARTQRPIRALRSQTVELACAFPFTERDFIRVALRSSHAPQEVRGSGPLYLARIFSYKVLVDDAHAYRGGCEGTMTVRLVAPPCAHLSGRVLLYGPPGTGGVGGGVASRWEELASPPLAFNWLTGENQTEFNCSLFLPGTHRYCLRLLFNYSHAPSPAHTCLLVHRSTEVWGPWEPWSACSVSCGEGVRERGRVCLRAPGVGGPQCSGMVKEQSLCSLEACPDVPPPSPSLPSVPVGVAPLGGTMVVVVGISLCLAVIVATVLVTLWRRFCYTPQCSAGRPGSAHSPGGRKLSDEASICGHSLQRPSLSEGQSPAALGAELPSPGGPPLSPTLVMSPDPERLSPAGQKMLPTILGYRLAQQQLKEMKRKGLKEATGLYHVSSSPVHDTVMESSSSPAHSPVATPTSFTHSALSLGLQDTNARPCHVRTPAPPPGAPRVAPDRLSPRVDLVFGPPVATHTSKWRERTADWVEMVERTGMAGHRRGAEPAGGTSHHGNPNFRRTSSFNDTRLQQPSSAESREFRGRSLTQVGSRTLPEGRSWTRRGAENQPYRAPPIPEHAAQDWIRTRVLREGQTETHSPGRKHTGTNTNGSPTDHQTGGQRGGGQASGVGGQRGGGQVSGVGGQRGGGQVSGVGGQRGGGQVSGVGGQRGGDLVSEIGAQRGGGQVSGVGGQRGRGQVSGVGGQKGGDLVSGVGGQRGGGQVSGVRGQRGGGQVSGVGGQRGGGQVSGVGGQRGGDLVSGVGGPGCGPRGPQAGSQLNVDRAEQNWNRRGPSPIQRNMLARRLKEAQSGSGVKGRQRSSTFSVAPSVGVKGRCRSLPPSGSSHYRLSEAEQRMMDLDLDLSSGGAGQDQD